MLQHWSETSSSWPIPKTRGFWATLTRMISRLSFCKGMGLADSRDKALSQIACDRVAGDA